MTNYYHCIIFVTDGKFFFSNSLDQRCSDWTRIVCADDKQVVKQRESELGNVEIDNPESSRQG